MDSMLYKESILQGTTDVWKKDTNHYTKIPHPNLMDSTLKTYLIGSKVGEIIVWKKDVMPILWVPIWSIQLKRCKRFKKAIATFLGNDMSTSAYRIQNCSKDKIKRWKKIVLHSRKKIKTLRTDKISTNEWKKFLKIMKDV